MHIDFITVKGVLALIYILLSVIIPISFVFGKFKLGVFIAVVQLLICLIMYFLKNNDPNVIVIALRLTMFLTLVSAVSLFIKEENNV